METEGGGVTLWQRMEGADLPAQVDVKLSEFLAQAGGGTWWKNNFQHVCPPL